MLLRPGRWCKNKPLFHIIVPILATEDFEGLAQVLYSLANIDEDIKYEIMEKLTADSGETLTTAERVELENKNAKFIIFDVFDGLNLEELRLCFNKIRGEIFKDSTIKQFCRENNIKTSTEYMKLREKYDFLPEDPREEVEDDKKVSWYKYLNGEPKIKLITMQMLLGMHEITNFADYEKRLCVFSGWPSLQNIKDGYFNLDNNEYLFVKARAK